MNFCFKVGGGDLRISEDSSKIEYFMPYCSANLFKSEPFQSLGSYVIALKKKTYVYQEKDKESKVIDTLCYEIVPINYAEYDKHWVQVIFNDEREGYVSSSDEVYTIDTRCGLENESGIWKLKYTGSFDSCSIF